MAHTILRILRSVKSENITKSDGGTTWVMLPENFAFCEFILDKGSGRTYICAKPLEKQGENWRNLGCKCLTFRSLLAGLMAGKAARDGVAKALQALFRWRIALANPMFCTVENFQQT